MCRSWYLPIETPTAFFARVPEGQGRFFIDVDKVEAGEKLPFHLEPLHRHEVGNGTSGMRRRSVVQVARFASLIQVPSL